jgi:membrane-associated phospholipid phosphatase
MFASSFMQPLRIESLFEILAIIFIVTFIIPVISIGTLRLTNFITDIQLEEKNQRLVPFLFIACFYGITAYMFYSKLSVNNLIVIVFAATTILILLITLITFFWKISAHGSAVGGVMGFICGLAMMHPIANFAAIMAVLAIIAGLVVYARLMLNMHTPAQAYVGVILGFSICYLSIISFM